MKIIISPAKQMKIENDYNLPLSYPIYKDKTLEILNILKSMNYDELKTLWSCSDKLAKENYENIKNLDLDYNTTPAILAYDGIQYKYMACDIFEKKYFTYVQEHLYILSGFYGILKPLDRIVPYRLEMQAKLKINNCSNLYEYWKDDLYKVMKDEDYIINLASKEYSKCISKYIDKDKLIAVMFCEKIKNKLVEKGVYCKMARGEMVRYMAENNIEDINEIKKFNYLNYKFDKDLSNENTFIFIKE